MASRMSSSQAITSPAFPPAAPDACSAASPKIASADASLRRPRFLELTRCALDLFCRSRRSAFAASRSRFLERASSSRRSAFFPSRSRYLDRPCWSRRSACPVLNSFPRMRQLVATVILRPLLESFPRSRLLVATVGLCPVLGALLGTESLLREACLLRFALEPPSRPPFFCAQRHSLSKNCEGFFSARTPPLFLI